MQSGFIDVFRNKNFLKLWLSQIFSQTSNHLLNFLLVVKVFDLTQSNLKVSILILCFTIPSVLFSVYAGIMADRFSQKRIMYTVNLLRAVLAFGYIFFDLNLVLVYVFTFCIGSAMQFFLPAEAARIPAIVDKKDYLAANSLYISTNYAAMIIGFSAVSFIQFIHGDYQFLMISIGFLISFLILLTLPYDRPEFSEINKKSLFGGIKKEFLGSWKAIKSKAGIYMPIIYLIFIWIAFGVAYVLVPPLTKQILNIPTADAGKYIVLPAVVGTAIGAIVGERIGKLKSKTFLISTGIFIVGIVALLVSLIPEVKEVLIGGGAEFALYSVNKLIKGLIIIFLLGMIGFGAMFIVAPSQTMLQENTDEGMMGKVFGFLNMITNVVNMLPVLAIGFIADKIPVKLIIFFLASMVILFGFLNIFYISIRKKSFKKL